jgi:hypothetical protein
MRSDCPDAPPARAARFARGQEIAMPRHLCAAVIAAAVLASSTASAQQVTRDWDKTYDFSRVKTFSIRMGTGWGNPLSEERVITDVADALVERGWQRGTEGSTDALVVLHGATETKRNLNTFYDTWGGWGWSAAPGMSTTTVSEYRVGTLVVDVFDAKTQKLAFRGSATDELSKDPKKNEKKSDKAAQKLFKEFPPTPKAK